MSVLKTTIGPLAFKNTKVEVLNMDQMKVHRFTAHVPKDVDVDGRRREIQVGEGKFMVKWHGRQVQEDFTKLKLVFLK